MAGGQRLGLLGGVRMLVAFVHFELGHQHPAQPVLGNHAPHGVGDELLGLLGANLLDGPVSLAAFPAGIAHELLLGLLLAGEEDLLGVDDDDEVAGIQVRRIDGFVLPAQDIGDLRRQAAQDGAIGVNHVPLALVQIDFRQMRFHLKS